jgi:hypothetical protein
MSATATMSAFSSLLAKTCSVPRQPFPHETARPGPSEGAV